MSNNNKDTVIASLKRKGHNFEIYVNLENALKFKEGKIKDIKDVLIYQEIFKDAKKGERVSSDLLKEVFKTDDIYKIAEIIVKEGEINITTEYKRKLIEEKRKNIIEYIRRLCIDANTNAPLTIERIENLLQKVRYNIDPFKDTIEQANEIIKEIRKIYPIKIEYKKIKIVIPYNKMKYIEILKRKYKLYNEFYDENYTAIFEVPAAILSEFYSDIKKIDPNIYSEEIIDKSSSQ